MTSIMTLKCNAGCYIAMVLGACIGRFEGGKRGQCPQNVTLPSPMDADAIVAQDGIWETVC